MAVTGAADPFAVRSGGPPQGPPVSPPAAGGAEAVRPVGDINDWFRKLCQSPSGVLYEDNYLQVKTSSACLCLSDATFSLELLVGISKLQKHAWT